MKKLLASALLLFALTACSANNYANTKIEEAVAEPEITCDTGTLIDQIFCLLDEENYSEVSFRIGYNSLQDEMVYKMFRDYSKIMESPDSSSSDEVLRVQLIMSNLADREKIDRYQALPHIQRLSDMVIKKTNESIATNQKKLDEMYYNPAIGMTEEKVLLSNWGKPKDVNRTTTAYGVREQWVYYGGRYVYFENGIVTSIRE